MLPQVAWRRTQSANHNAVPDDHCIAELFAPSSARGMAGAEAGKRNIPGTACLRLVRAHVIIADEAPTALTEPVLGKCYTRVSQGVAPCLPGLTADGLERRSGMATAARGYVDTLSLFRLCLSVLTIGCVRSTACQRQLQLAVRRFATWDRLASRHSVKVTYPPAVLLPDRLNESCRSLALFCTLPTPQLLDFVMMAFTSRQHALEMNCGAAAPSALSYWAALVPRGSHVREFAPYLIHLSIAIPIHLHTHPIAAYHMCVVSNSVSLLGSKRVFIVRFSAARSSND